MKKTLLMVMVLSTAALASAKENRWHFTAGPGWRVGMDIEMKLGVSQGSGGAGAIGGQYDDGFVFEENPVNPAGTRDWGGGTIGGDGVTGYTLTLHRAFFDGDASASEKKSAPGFVVSLGYDVFQGRAVTLGARVGFAGYFGLMSSFEGESITATDTFGFTMPPMAPVPGFTPLDTHGTRTVTPMGRHEMRVEANFYQFGIGPEFAWEPVEGLRLSVALSVLLSSATVRVSGGETTSASKFLLGGGLQGEVAYYFEKDSGLFCGVGYEKVQKAEVSGDGADVAVDFSGVVVSAGVRARF